MSQSMSYVEEWIISSKAMEAAGIYNDIIEKFPVKDRIVLELGCGAGSLSILLAEEGPKSLVCVDYDTEMLNITKRTLESAGYVVEYVDTTNSISFDDMRYFNKNAIVLAKADYRDFTQMSNPLLGSDFDICFRTFTGGICSITSADPYEDIIAAMNSVHPILKSEGKFVYVDRDAFVDKHRIERFPAPIGYELLTTTIDENADKVKATFWGNRKCHYIKDGRIHTIEAKGPVADGVVATEFYKEIQNMGRKLAIICREFTAL